MLTSRKKTDPRSRPTSSPGGVGAKSWTTPPGPRGGGRRRSPPGWLCRQRPGRRAPAQGGAHSSGSGPGSAVAPAASARARRSARGSTAATAAAPAVRAARISNSPIAPAPTTATRDPGPTPAQRWPRTTQASGSMSGRPVGQRVGQGEDVGACVLRRHPTSWARPPGSMRVRRKAGHSVWRPARQRAQVMHGTWWCTNTRSPMAKGRPRPPAPPRPPARAPAPAGPAGPGTRP